MLKIFVLGETSTTPLSPGSPADDSSSEIHSNKPRLQRVKAQSRKTFRLRKSRKNRMEVRNEIRGLSGKYPTCTYVMCRTYFEKAIVNQRRLPSLKYSVLP